MAALADVDLSFLSTPNKVVDEVSVDAVASEPDFRALLDDYIQQSRPFVVRGAAANWPASQLWNAEYLADKVGRESVLPLRANDYADGSWLGRRVDVAFGEYVAEWEELRVAESGDVDASGVEATTTDPVCEVVTTTTATSTHAPTVLPSDTDSSNTNSSNSYSSNDDNSSSSGNCSSNDNTSSANNLPSLPYLASLPLNKHAPALAGDVVPPPYAAEQGKTGNLWMGAAGQITPVHYDYSGGEPGMDGLHYLLKGSKTFRLYDPLVNLGALAQRKREWWRWHHAAVDVEAPDYSRFPEFLTAVAHVVTLSAGDMLFIPKLWWHQVHTHAASVAVNFWFEHIESEELKLTLYRPVVGAHLAAAAAMDVPREKLRNVLSTYGVKGTRSDEVVDSYAAHPLRILALPLFLETFGNGARSPYLKHHGQRAEDLALQLIAQAKEWVDRKLAEEGAALDTRAEAPAAGTNANAE